MRHHGDLPLHGQPEPPARSRAVTVLAIGNFVWAGLYLAAGVYLVIAGSHVASLFAATPPPAGADRKTAAVKDVGTTVSETLTVLVAVAAVLLFLQAVPLVLAGLGVLRRRRWGRFLTLLLGGFALFQGLSLLASGKAGLIFPGLVLAGYAVAAFVILLRRPAAAEFASTPVRRHEEEQAARVSWKPSTYGDEETEAEPVRRREPVVEPSRAREPAGSRQAAPSQRE
jgi:hypothetical protein